jgi:transposase-like protein
VALALATEESRASVAQRLGVNETTLRNWVADHLAEEARQADPLAATASEFEELRRLRREVAEGRAPVVNAGALPQPVRATDPLPG